MPTSTENSRKLEEVNQEPFKLKFYTEASKKAAPKHEGVNTEAAPKETGDDEELAAIEKRLRRTLAKIEGISNVTIDLSTRTATFDYCGTWLETESVQRRIAAEVPAYLISPAPILVKLAFPAQYNKTALAGSIMGTTGMRHAHLLPNGAEVQFDVEAGKYESVLQLFVDAGIKIEAGGSHRFAQFKVKGNGDLEALRAGLDNTKGILAVEVKEQTIVLTAYGKNWKDEVEPLVKAAGFEIDGKLLVK